MSKPEVSVAERIAGRQERLHVALGAMCNNNCLFCCEVERDGWREHNAGMTPERVRWILEAHRGAEEVCFTSGEPTTRPDLALFARWARELGYPTVSLMTNGRRLSYRAYAESLAAAGFNRFCVSIHGHSRQLHEGLTRTPGSFAQTQAGLANAARLHAQGVELHTSTVVTTRNLPHLPQIYRFLRQRGVAQVVFNVMQPTGRAAQHLQALFPPYRAIAEAFVAFVTATPNERPSAFLVDIPLCLTEQCPDFNRGFVESQFHYALVPEAKAAQPDGTMTRHSRAELDQERRQKRPECRGCHYDRVCEGVWREYVNQRGWEEFVPVTRT